MSESTEESARPTRVMVIGAHPDDPEFGCAATVAKYASEGKEITYLLFTSGDKGSRDLRTPPGEMATIREREQRAAAEKLGVAKVIFRRHPDGLLENTMALRQEVAMILREEKPDVVLAIDPWRRYQLHPDHRAAGLVALDAIYAAREWYIFPEQLVGDITPWRVKDVYLYWTDMPDHWEDVGGCLDRRFTALQEHTSQVGERIDRIIERIREGAANTAKEAKVDPKPEFAEAFKHIKLG